MNDGYRGRRDHHPQDPYPYDPAYDPYAQQQPPGYDASYDPAYDAAYDPAQDPAYGSSYGYDQGYGEDQGYGYDPYAQHAPRQHAPPPPPPYAQQPQQQPQQQMPRQQPPPGYDAYDPYGPAASTGEQAAHTDTGSWARIPGQRPPEPAEREYRTEQFSFIEDTPDESEDVIDWLKFTESRTERREEAKRRGRHRKVALLVVFVLALLGGTGYLWATDRLGFLPGSDGGSAAAAADKRDVIVVHMHDTAGGGTATALLVDNASTGRGTTVLLPNDLTVSGDDGTAMSLGQSVEEEGAGATRDAIDRLLGSQIKGTWRLDTPFLENLVEGVGGITLDADATVPGEKKGEDPLVEEGKARDLDGRQAIAYATHRDEGEPQTAQLERFGQVMHAVLKKLPSDVEGVENIVKALGMISDPSLSNAQLSASLAGLAELAGEGSYATRTLAVDDDGRPSEKARESVVEDVLGGTVKAPAGDAPARVSVKNGTGDAAQAESAKVSLVNGGFTFIDGGEADAASASRVLYGEAADKEHAAAVARTLGLPAKAVAKGETAGNADVTVVLGDDYEG